MMVQEEKMIKLLILVIVDKYFGFVHNFIK